jgi:hypothetical protein
MPVAVGTVQFVRGPHGAVRCPDRRCDRRTHPRCGSQRACFSQFSGGHGSFQGERAGSPRRSHRHLRADNAAASDRTAALSAASSALSAHNAALRAASSALLAHNAALSAASLALSAHNAALSAAYSAMSAHNAAVHAGFHPARAVRRHLLLHHSHRVRTRSVGSSEYSASAQGRRWSTVSQKAAPRQRGGERRRTAPPRASLSSSRSSRSAPSRRS